MRIESQERIAGAQIGAAAVKDNKELQSKQFIEGTKIGIQAVQTHQDMQHQKELAQMNQQPQE